MAAGIPTTIFQSTDTFIVDIAWLAADVTPTVVAHGLGGAPQEIYMTSRIQNAAPVFPGLTATADATNLTAGKLSAAAATDCTVRYTLRRRVPPGRLP